MRQINSHEHPFFYSLYAVARGLVLRMKHCCRFHDYHRRPAIKTGATTYRHRSAGACPPQWAGHKGRHYDRIFSANGLKRFGILACALLILLLAIIPGCSRKSILSDDAVRIRKIHDFVRELKGLYEQRDMKILTRFSPDFLTEIGDPIQKDFEKFNSISLDLFTDRIEMYNGDVNISIQWNGIWKGSEKTYREGGSMVLLTRYGEGIKIIGIKGDSPFGITSLLGNSGNKFLPELK